MKRSLDTGSVADAVFKSAQDDLARCCSGFANQHADVAESEIELMLLTAFEITNLFYCGSRGVPIAKILKDGETCSISDARVIVRPQHKWENYRIDMRIDVDHLGYPVFVECDGHDFHERTKEQAERDRSRDRAIQAANIPIIRFTGREIYRDPLGCVSEILKFVVSRFESRSE